MCSAVLFSSVIMYVVRKRFVLIDVERCEPLHSVVVIRLNKKTVVY